MKKLYRTTIDVVAYAWAESCTEADGVLRNSIKEVMDAAGYTHEVCEPTHMVDRDWRPCIPFGDVPAEYENMTVGETQEARLAELKA